MKILVLPKPIEGVPREELLQYAAEEIQAMWELYAQGICYNAELDTIDIGGLNMGETQKYRNVAYNGLASFVVDDIAPPFQPRGIEIRGHAEALPDGGQRISPTCSTYGSQVCWFPPTTRTDRILGYSALRNINSYLNPFTASLK